MDDAIRFIEYLLQKFDHEGVVTMEWSNCCGKPRLDAFGGGAAIITAAGTKWMNTREWVRETSKHLNVLNDGTN